MRHNKVEFIQHCPHCGYRIKHIAIVPIGLAEILALIFGYAAGLITMG